MDLASLRRRRQEVRRARRPRSPPPRSPTPAAPRPSKSTRTRTRTTTPRVPRWRASTKSPADLGDALDKGLDDFRNKKLFDFGFSDPTKLEVKGVTYTKSGDKWMSGGKTMDNSTVQNLIDKLRDLDRHQIRRNRAAAQPVFDATVTSNDGKRVEKVTITKQGDQYFAQREGEPSIYELDGKAVDDLQKAASDVKEAATRAGQEEIVRRVGGRRGDTADRPGRVQAIRMRYRSRSSRRLPRYRCTHERPSHRPLRAHHGRRLLRSRQGRREGHLRTHHPPPAAAPQLRPGRRPAAGGRLPAQPQLHRRRNRLPARPAAVPPRVARPSSITCATSASPATCSPCPKARRCSPASRC